ncbi:MAG TPA: toll/interleukin-1 receptor domain-containing protein [Thermoleophilia bacterium]|nr:toll/interleukin-1 receptor domain-containing protein [Thermoleophilia bacterium]
MAHDVFISYAFEDKVVADAVCAALEADHVRCYIAPRDVLPGQRYAQALVDAIHGAKVFVLVFSAASNASHQVEREVDRAVSCGLPVLPLRVEDVMPCDWLEYYLAGQHWLDALTPPLESHLSRLSNAIEVLLKPPVAGEHPVFKDEWREVATEIGEPLSAEEPISERTPAPPPDVGEEVPEAVAAAAAPLSPAAPPRPAATEKSPEAVHSPEVVERPAATLKAPPAPPPATRRPPKVVGPTPVSGTSLSATVTPAAAASVESPEPFAAPTRAAKPGRRPAVIAAAVVGASWLVVLIAIDLLIR